MLVTVTPKQWTFVSPREALHVCGTFGNPEEGQKGKGISNHLRDI